METEEIAQEQPESTEVEPQVDATTPQPQGSDKSIMIPKDRFDEVNNERKELRKQLEEFKTLKQRAEEETKKQQGKYQELYEKAQADLEAQQKAVAELEHNMLRKEVAAAAGYAALWNRIEGGDQAELEADLKALIKALPKPQAPDLDGAAGSGSLNGSGAPVTEAEKKELAARLGLRVQDLPDTGWAL